MIKHFEVSGNYYECGFQIGQALKKVIQKRLDRLVTKEIFSIWEKDLPKVEEVCQSRFPNLISEIQGVADGAEVDFKRVLLLNCEELRYSEKGCTTIAEVSSKEISLTHNEDTGAEIGDHIEDCILITYNLPNLTFTSFLYAGELPGSAYNWNNLGLYFSVNYLDPLDPIPYPDRIPRDFTARALIEARDLEEALKILGTTSDASGYHYYIGKGDEIISVEQNLDKLSVLNVTGVIAHSNHYTHPQFANNMDIDQSSKFRLKRANEMIDDHKEALKILSDRTNAPYTICRLPEDDGLTLSTVKFLPRENKVIIYTPLSIEKEYELKLVKE